MKIKKSICFFVVGLILAGFVTEFLFHGYSDLLDGWRKDSKKFYLDEIGFTELNEIDENRFQENSNEGIARFLSWTSFAFFILGSLSTGAVMICGHSILATN